MRRPLARGLAHTNPLRAGLFSSKMAIQTGGSPPISPSSRIYSTVAPTRLTALVEILELKSELRLIQGRIENQGIVFKIVIDDVSVFFKIDELLTEHFAGRIITKLLDEFDVLAVGFDDIAIHLDVILE